MDPPKIIQRPLDQSDGIDHDSLRDSQLEDDEPDIKNHHFVIPEGDFKNCEL